ncbi:hypothetical protein D3C76_1356750 [compost metagenome]
MAIIESKAWELEDKNGCPSSPRLSSREFTTPFSGFSMILHSTQAVGTDTATGTKWTERKNAIPWSRPFNRMARRKAKMMVNGSSSRLNSTVFCKDFQNIGSRNNSA